MSDLSLILLVLFALLQYADIHLTARILQKGGWEMNPLARKFMAAFGMSPGLLLLKGLGAAPILGILYFFAWSPILLGFSCILQGGVVAWNVRILNNLKAKQ